MSSALTAIEVGRKDVLALCAKIPDAVWAEESGCPGWSVRDLVSHMACSFWLAVDPTKLPDPGGMPAERAADLYVESRRSMTPEEVVADYESVSSRGLELLAAVEGQDIEIPLGDVGTYPASVVPAAFAFEIFVHVRSDLFKPNGPLEGEPSAVCARGNCASATAPTSRLKSPPILWLSCGGLLNAAPGTTSE